MSSGYDRSPDYGDPPPNPNARWDLLGAAVVVVIILALAL